MHICPDCHKEYVNPLLNKWGKAYCRGAGHKRHSKVNLVKKV